MLARCSRSEAPGSGRGAYMLDVSGPVAPPDVPWSDWASAEPARAAAASRVTIESFMGQVSDLSAAHAAPLSSPHYFSLALWLTRPRDRPPSAHGSHHSHLGARPGRRSLRPAVAGVPVRGAPFLLGGLCRADRHGLRRRRGLGG